MMPNAEEIAPYVPDLDIIYRLSGSPELKVQPLADDKIKVSCSRKSRKTFRTTWFERHFDVVCIDNAIRILPTAAIPYDGKPEIDPYTLGTASPEAVASGMKIVEHVLGYAGAIVGEHICRDRLERWRVASLSDSEPASDQPGVEALWFRFMEAETAMAWSYPAYECDYIKPVEPEATGMRI